MAWPAPQRIQDAGAPLKPKDCKEVMNAASLQRTATVCKTDPLNSSIHRKITVRPIL